MKKEKILIVHNYYQVPGGEDTVVANEKKMLEDNGHEVIMYTRHNDEIKECGLLGKVKLAFETIYSFKTKREVKKIIKENNIDIVHVHNTLPLISPSVYKAARDCGVKVVQTVHNFRLICPAATFTCNGSICEECLSKGLKCAIKNKCYRNSRFQTILVVVMLMINRFIGSYKNVNTYIVLTEFSKNKMSNFTSNKIAIKPNFTNNDKNKILSATKRKYFLFVGRLDKLKGINILLDTWKCLRNETLIIVGSGPEKEYINSYITENRMDNIKLLGKVESNKVKELMAYAKAVIVPSIWYETFGMVNIEAFSVGTPVIATDIGALADVVNEKNGIKFKIGSKKELYSAVNILLDNEVLTKYIYNAHKTYICKYTESKNYKILSEIYRK